MTPRVLLIFLLAAAVLAPAAAAGDRYHVEIRRTAGGVPHVKAHDWASLGFGQGYAYAQDNLCTLADEIVTIRAERSRYHGADANPAGLPYTNLESDFLWRWLNEHGTPRPGHDARRMIRGYADGYNRYLRDIGGRDGVPDPRCRGKAWVRSISELDLRRRMLQLVLRASSGSFVRELVAARPPGAAVAARRRRAPDTERWWSRRLGDAESSIGSNGLALGREATAGGTGMLLANPHFPWKGGERFYESHLTLPGRYDAIGGGLGGLPGVQIGHNANVAWTHMVSHARRFTLHQLELVPGDPTAYRYDGRTLRMKPETVRVTVRRPQGGYETRSHTFWSTRWGPMVDLAATGLPWGATTGYAFADANASNPRALDTWLAMGRARDVDELLGAAARHQGIPWVHTVAADDRGRAAYADYSVVPHVDAAKIADCLPPGVPAAVFKAARIVTLDGSRAECAWGTDPDAAAPGIFGPQHLPRLVRDDYVQNSNDSHWLANPAQPLTGFSPIIGLEGVEQGLRTRIGNDIVARRLAGTDGLGAPGFTLPTLQRAWQADRSLGAELTRDRLVAICREHPTIELADGRSVDVREACPILERYDTTGNLDAPGGWLFAEWWSRAAGSATPAGFWADAFDPQRPLTTPVSLNTASPRNVRSLGEAVDALRARGLPLDAPYGAVQRGPGGIPIHGCASGCYQTITPALTPGPEYGEVVHGSSFVMAVEFTRHGPRGEAVLTYSQSENPLSPHFADQTALFSNKRWLALPFTEQAIQAAADERTVIDEG